MKSRDTTAPPKGERKKYRRPVLERYGNILKLTRIVGGTVGASDHAPKGNKTGL